jgi:aldose sugar dehydrogenase
MIHFKKIHLLLLGIAIIPLCAFFCQTGEFNHPQTDPTFTYETIETGIAVPWGMAFLPNGDMLVTDKSGKIRIIREGKLLPEMVEGVPAVFTRGQGGLFDLELHPDYKNNGWIYISYAGLSEKADEKGGMTHIMRAKLKDNKLVDQQILFKGYPYTNAGQHFGARMEFGSDGYLYFSIGERGEMHKAQSLETCNGKVYRIKDDGGIPADNPFVNVKGAIPAVYSYGHRNPQGLALHPITGEMWETEHGPKGGDELNIIGKGKNYGWPVITYGIDYNGSIISEDSVKEGMEQPVTFWRPSIATSNLVFVTSDKYPNWKGNILVCGMALQCLERLEIANNKMVKREKIIENMGRVRNVAESPEGYIFVALDGGKVLKLIPKNEKSK